MEFSTVISILACVLVTRNVISSLSLLITKALFNEDFKYNLKWLNTYLVRKSSYKMVVTLSYIIVINVMQSLNYPTTQYALLVGMVFLREVTVFIYYELPSNGYSQMKHGLDHYRWLIV